MSNKEAAAAAEGYIIYIILRERGGEDAWDEQRKSKIIWRAQ